MADRISTLTQTSSLMSNNMRLQSMYAETQTQISSKLKSTNYTGFGSQAGIILDLEQEMTELQQQTDNTEIAINRLEVMWSTLNSVEDQIQDFMNTLQQSLSGMGLSDTTLAASAETGLSQLASMMNIQLAGRYLFSGAATETAPIDINDAGWGGQIYTAPGPSVADTDYYQGNDYVQSIESSDGFYISYGVTADDPAFEQIFRAFDLVINNSGDRDALAEAYSLLESGLDDIITINAKISQNSKMLENQALANETEINLIANQLTETKQVDLAEASVILAQIETQLEASYTVTSAMLNLKLSDYM